MDKLLEYQIDHVKSLKTNQTYERALDVSNTVIGKIYTSIAIMFRIRFETLNHLSNFCNK